MSLIVAKFGGTSLATPAAIKSAARKIAQEHEHGNQVCVVVSAMSGETNRLIDLAREVTPVPDAAEYDSVVATGEQVSSGLMAMALNFFGIPARSWAGWQVPLRTSPDFSRARIADIPGEEIRTAMQGGIIPVITGFQGVTEDLRITTLGRGGSDTSAVAVAAALKADRCDIYTDVEGVFTADPRLAPRARKISMIVYEEMLELASLGAKVLQTRAVVLAMRHNLKLQVLSSFSEKLGSDLPGTLVIPEQEAKTMMEEQIVSGIAHSRDEAKITLIGVPDRPGIAAAIFGPLSQAGINVDMIVQNISANPDLTDLTFTVARGDAGRAGQALQEAQAEIGNRDLLIDTEVAKISVVGMGMRSHTGVAQQMFRTLSEKGINIQVISTSEIKISVLVQEHYTELAVRILHDTYELDKSE